MNIQGWFPLGLTGLISLLSKGLSRVFFRTTVQRHQFFGTQPFILSSSVIREWLLKKLYLWLDGPLLVMSLLFNTLSRFFIAFLPRSKRFLISWLQSPSTVILELKTIKSVTVSIAFPSICHELMGPDAMIFMFWMLSLKPAFSFSSFTFIKRLFILSAFCH